MADQAWTSWSDSGTVSVELHPVLEPKFAEASVVDLVKGWEKVSVPIEVANLVPGTILPVQAELQIHLGSGTVRSISLSGVHLRASTPGKAFLGTATSDSLQLPLAALSIYGVGKVDLTVSSGRFADRSFSKVHWANLKRPFLLEVEGHGTLDLAVALRDESAFPYMVIGTPLRFKAKELPQELKSEKVSVGVKFRGQPSLVALATSGWSQGIQVGISGDAIESGIIGVSEIAAKLVIGTSKETNGKTKFTGVLSVALARGYSVPRLEKFTFEEASMIPGMAMYSALYARSFRMRRPLLVWEAQFSGVHESASFHLDLVPLYSPDGSLFELEMLRFKTPDLTSASVSMMEVGERWTAKAVFTGGRGAGALISDFVRSIGPAEVLAENPFCLALCMTNPLGKVSKTQKAPLTISTVLMGLDCANAVLPRTIVPDRAVALATNRKKANAFTSNLLNVVEGESKWTRYPKTLDEVLTLQMSLKGTNAPARKEGEHASKAEVREMLDATQRAIDPIKKFEFMRIDKEFTVPDDKLEAWLEAYSKKVSAEKTFHLKGTGSTFNKAARENKINVAYCLAHCLAETGGTAIRFTDSSGAYFNAYGIGAFDGASKIGATAWAKKQGWTTPQKAIEGGLRWIAQEFMTKSGLPLNTPYKLRWNPDNPAHDQYCTGIVWCGNIAVLAHQIALLGTAADQAKLLFDFPLYKDQVEP